MAVIQEIKVPLLAVNDSTLNVVEVSFQDGHLVKKGDTVLVFETSKTTYTVEASVDGFIQYHCVVGNEYEVNDLVATIFTEASEIISKKIPGAIASDKPPVHSEPVVFADHLNWEGDTLFSREALKLIESSGLKKDFFSGKDFVSVVDVQQRLGISKEPATVQRRTAAVTKNKTAPAIDKEKFIVEKLTSGKKREIEYLSEVQSTGLTSTVNINVDTNGIFVHVNQAMKYLKNSLLPIIIYESSRLLKKYQLLNAYYTDGNLALYKEVNVGFAIDIDKGLKVVKIGWANEKTLAQVESDIMELSEKYLDDKLDINDLTEISFTITDLSAEGVSFFRPLINMMNSAILGISSIDEKLERCTLSMTFDHRVTEGKLAAKFLNELKERLESYRGTENINTSAITCFKCDTPLSEDLSNVGFVNCLKPDGKPGYICQRCFKGF